MANAAVFFALLDPGDTLLVQSEDGGGNYSYHRRGPAGLMRANIVSIPPGGRAFDIDLEALRRQAREHRPKMIVIGGSNVLFPYPVREVRAIADEIVALVLYDAAHLGLLLAGGNFQSPLAEGAHLVAISSAKSMGGPLGGLVLTNDAEIAARVIGITFPGFVQMRDENKYSGQALALAEMLEFAPVLAERTVANAQALASALAAQDFDVIGGERGYTRTHQIFLNLGDRAQAFEARCHAANILLSDCALVGDMSRGRRSGARLATHELTRIGMDEADMHTIASFIARAARGDDAAAIASEVTQLVARYPTVKYSFDESAR
jgi:glycine hydroxymethyltransferase